MSRFAVFWLRNLQQLFSAPASKRPQAFRRLSNRSRNSSRYPARRIEVVNAETTEQRIDKSWVSLSLSLSDDLVQQLLDEEFLLFGRQG